MLRKCLEEGPRNVKYTVPEIQNELLDTMAEMVLNHITSEIQKAQYYSLIVDETKDISKKEQLSVVIRYVIDGVTEMHMNASLDIPMLVNWMLEHSLHTFVMC